MSNKTKTDTTTSEQKNKLDPRMDALLYGDGTAGNTGFLNRATELSKQPAINDRMRQGLDAQYNYLQSPQYQAIFNQLLGGGQNLMGRGVAGNPFTRSGAGAGGGGGMMQGFGAPQGGGYQPNYTPSQPSQQAQPQPQQAMPQQVQAPQQQGQLTPEELAFMQRMYQVNTNSA